MKRVYNFSAGPSTLPEPVLKRAADEMLCYGNSGMSVMEMSHRSSYFDDIIKEAESLLREIMNIPSNYKVLFLQGGASTQFAMIPLNLMTHSNEADFVLTGSWAKKAYNEAKRYGKCSVIASSEDKTFSYIPKLDPAAFNKNADYFHICYNNTIYGTKYSVIPETGNVPLVADMSSCILSEPVDVSKFGIIYAGAQKNMGPAGVTVVIIRDDLVGDTMESTPTMLKYSTHVEKNSLYNTPPCYSIYICKLVYQWLKDLGGLKAMEEINREKASLIYDYLDNSSMFNPTVSGDDRSLMNIPFVTGNKDIDKKFVSESKAAGFENLKGHRSVGGMRASIYNAMPVEGVRALVDFMKKFEFDNK